MDLSLCGLASEFILCCSKWSWHVLCSYLSKMKIDFKTQLFKRICTQKPLLIMGTVLNRLVQVHSQWHICEAPLLALCQFSSCLSGFGSRSCSPIFRVYPHPNQAKHDRHFRWDSNGEPLLHLLIFLCYFLLIPWLAVGRSGLWL